MCNAVTSSRRTACAAAVVLFALLLAARPAAAGTMQDFAYDYRHQQIANQAAYDSVGFLQMSGAGGSFVGSGVVIGKRWIMTAAHCVAGMSSVRFTINGKTYAGKDWYVHGGYSYDVFGNGHDIALVRLTKPVKAKPATLARPGTNPVGKKAVIVGYGTTGTGLTGNTYTYGTKRAGYNKIDSYYGGLNTGGRILQYDFDPPADFLPELIDNADDFPISLEYCGAQGDSGGGVFVGHSVAGITSFGSSGSYFYTVAGSTNVALHYPWIKRLLNRVNNGLPVAADLGNAGSPLPDLTSASATLGGVEFAALRYQLPTGLAAVPEPAAGLLLLTGIAALTVRRTRRRAH